MKRQKFREGIFTFTSFPRTICGFSGSTTRLIFSSVAQSHEVTKRWPPWVCIKTSVARTPSSPPICFVEHHARRSAATGHLPTIVGRTRGIKDHTRGERGCASQETRLVTDPISSSFQPARDFRSAVIVFKKTGVWS